MLEYVKAIDLLTIDPTKRLQLKVQDLESMQSQEIVQLRQKVKEMEEQRAKELVKLKARMEKIDEQLQYLDEERTNAYYSGG